MIIRAAGAALFSASLTLMVAGCTSHVDDQLIASADFASSGQGVAVFDFTPIERNCSGSFKAILGTYQPAKSVWTISTQLSTKELGVSDNGDGDKATEATLPAGEYGLLAVSCILYRRTVTLTAERADNGPGLFKFQQPEFRRPLATFTVKAGEVVDVGSVNAANMGPNHFKPSFGPMTAEVRAGLQAARPKLAAAMVSRLMVPVDVPGQPPAAQGAVKPSQ